MKSCKDDEQSYLTTSWFICLKKSGLGGLTHHVCMLQNHILDWSTITPKLWWFVFLNELLDWAIMSSILLTKNNSYLILFLPSFRDLWTTIQSETWNQAFGWEICYCLLFYMMMKIENKHNKQVIQMPLWQSKSIYIYANKKISKPGIELFSSSELSMDYFKSCRMEYVLTNSHHRTLLIRVSITAAWEGSENSKACARDKRWFLHVALAHLLIRSPSAFLFCWMSRISAYPPSWKRKGVSHVQQPCIYQLLTWANCQK